MGQGGSQAGALRRKRRHRRGNGGRSFARSRWKQLRAVSADSQKPLRHNRNFRQGDEGVGKQQRRVRQSSERGNGRACKGEQIQFRQNAFRRRQRRSGDGVLGNRQRAYARQRKKRNGGHGCGRSGQRRRFKGGFETNNNRRQNGKEHHSVGRGYCRFDDSGGRRNHRSGQLQQGNNGTRRNFFRFRLPLRA